MNSANDFDLPPSYINILKPSQSLQVAVSRREHRIRVALSVLEELQREEHGEADALLVVGDERAVARSPRRGMRDRIAKRRNAEHRMLDQLQCAAPGRKTLRSRLEALAPPQSLGAAAATAAPSSARVAQWLDSFVSAQSSSIAVRDVEKPKLKGPLPSRAATRDAREVSMQYLSVSTLISMRAPSPPSVSSYRMFPFCVTTHTHPYLIEEVWRAVR